MKQAVVCSKCKTKFANDPTVFEVFTSLMEKTSYDDKMYYQRALGPGSIERRMLCSECKTKLDQWFDAE